MSQTATAQELVSPPHPGRRVGQPLYRPLKVYAFDPGRGKTFGNYMTIQVPYKS